MDRTRKRLTDVLEKSFSLLNLGNGSSSGSQNLGTGYAPEVTEISWATSSGELRSSSSQKHVQFSEDVETVEFDVNEPVENISVFRSIPKTWDRIMKRHQPLQSLRVPLQVFCRGVRPLIIECCCEQNSGIRQACETFRIPYFGVTRSVDLSNTHTMQLLRAILDRRGAIGVWISSPCTAGCRYRFINNRTPAGLSKWKSRYAEHRQIWLSLRKIFEGRQDRSELLIAQEWPVYCDLFSCTAYQKTAQTMKLGFRSVVCRCCLDGIYKKWEVRTNSQLLAMQLETDPCRCTRPDGPRQLSLKKTGEYSSVVGEYFVSAFLNCTRKGGHQER